MKHRGSGLLRAAALVAILMVGQYAMADPVVLNRNVNPLFQIAAESATRAIRRARPSTGR